MAFMRYQRKDQASLRKKRGRQQNPPPFPGNSFDSVHRWERKFCSQMSWRDFCEKKQWLYLYPNVLNWDDSAGKEAFNSAEARYRAKINGLTCKIPLPDPDMYIDEIDHDAPIDPWLIEDLYKLPPPPPPLCEEIWDINSITPTGWDVDPSPPKNIPEFIFVKPHDIIDNSALRYQIGLSDEEIPIIPTGWGDEEETESTNDRYLQESQPNGAWNSKIETSKDRYRCWQQNDDNNGIIYKQMNGVEGSFGLKYTDPKRIMTKGMYVRDLRRKRIYCDPWALC